MITAKGTKEVKKEVIKSLYKRVILGQGMLGVIVELLEEKHPFLLGEKCSCRQIWSKK